MLQCQHTGRLILYTMYTTGGERNIAVPASSVLFLFSGCLHHSLPLAHWILLLPVPWPHNTVSYVPLVEAYKLMHIEYPAMQYSVCMTAYSPSFHCIRDEETGDNWWHKVDLVVPVHLPFIAYWMKRRDNLVSSPDLPHHAPLEKFSDGRVGTRQDDTRLIL